MREKLYEDTFSKDYYSAFKERIKRVIELFESHPEGRILDVGCGDGFLSKLIATKTRAEVYGLEGCRKLAKIARGNGIKVRIQDFDGNRFPFPSNFFDAIFCGEVLEHVVETENLIREMRRVLKPRGYAIITTPNIASWYNRILLFFGLMPIWIDSGSEGPAGHRYVSFHGHVKAFTRRALCEIVRRNGFEVERVRGSAFITGFPVFDFIERIFQSSSSLSSHLILKVRKSR